MLHAGWPAPVLRQLPQSLPRPAKGVMHVVVSRIECEIEMLGCTAKCSERTNMTRRPSAAACSHCECETASLEASMLLHLAMFEARVQGNSHNVWRHRDHRPWTALETLKTAASAQHRWWPSSQSVCPRWQVLRASDRCAKPLFRRMQLLGSPSWMLARERCTPWTRPNTSRQH